MLNIRSLPGFPSLAVFPAVFAIGVSGTAGAVEPRLYQLGDGGAIAPHLAVEVGSDNNPLRQFNGSDASSFLRLQPSLRYVVQRRNNSLNLTYTGDYYAYGEDYCLQPLDADCPNGSPQYNKASFQDHEFAADGFLEITRKVRATVLLERAIEHQPLGTGLSSNSGTLSTLVEPDSIRRSLLRAQVSYGAENARGEVRAGVTFTDREFAEDAANPARNFDALSERSTSPNLQLLYRIGTRTQAFTGFSRAQVRGGNSERDVTRYFAGLELDASAITSGSFRLSSVRENFLGNRTDIEYIGWDAEVTWKPRRFSTVTFSGGRETSRGIFNLDDPTLSTFIGDDIGITTDINVNWRHFWRDRFSTLASLSVEINDEAGQSGVSGVDANDRSTQIRLQGDYNIRRWLDIGAFVVTDRRNGDGDQRDYDRTLVGVSANGTF